MIQYNLFFDVEFNPEYEASIKRIQYVKRKCRFSTFPGCSNFRD